MIGKKELFIYHSATIRLPTAVKNKNDIYHSLRNKTNYVPANIFQQDLPFNVNQKVKQSGPVLFLKHCATSPTVFICRIDFVNHLFAQLGLTYQSTGELFINILIFEKQ